MDTLWTIFWTKLAPMGGQQDQWINGRIKTEEVGSHLLLWECDQWQWKRLTRNFGHRCSCRSCCCCSCCHCHCCHCRHCQLLLLLLLLMLMLLLMLLLLYLLSSLCYSLPIWFGMFGIANFNSEELQQRFRCGLRISSRGFVHLSIRPSVSRTICQYVKGLFNKQNLMLATQITTKTPNNLINEQPNVQPKQIDRQNKRAC